MKSNFVLIDFENVQPDNVGVLNGRSFKIKVFAGAHQSKVPFEMARAFQPFGQDVEYIRSDEIGKNALDFHIAYYIGRLAAENPNASFHVISKDKGFDPLTKHLKAQGISCQRSSSVTDIPGIKISSSKSISNTVDTIKVSDSRSVPEKVDVIIHNLAGRTSGRPKRLKTLRGTINALFKNKLQEAELDELIETLEKRGAIKVADGKVQYGIGP